MLRTVLLSLGVLAAPWPGLCQSPPAAPASGTPAASTRHPEEGRPFIRNYRPLEVGGGGQNWAMVQDSRGVIYVGSERGSSNSTGRRGDSSKADGIGTVRSLAIDESGRIYVGSVARSDFSRRTARRSAVELPGLALRGVAPVHDVWRTFVTNGVLFQTERDDFPMGGTSPLGLRAATRFNRGSMVDDRLYLTMPETGLNVLEGDTFRALPGD